MRFIPTLTALLICFSSSRISAQTALQSDSSAVADVVKRYYAALQAGDSTGVLALLSSDATILESGGIETRSEYRSHHLAGDIAFARAVKSTRSAISVTMSGNTAWATSTSTAVGEFNGRSINSSGAETMVLTRRDDGWQIRSIHWSSRARRPAR
jgi:ketosteroid isomerase-like protein